LAGTASSRMLETTTRSMVLRHRRRHDRAQRLCLLWRTPGRIAAVGASTITAQPSRRACARYKTP
jgi:hypothetical protein